MNKQKLVKLFDYIDNHTIRCEYTYRGGGIEIDASEYLKMPKAKLTAYQNYLGGGMLGAVQGDRNFSQCNTPRETKARELQEALKQYFFNLTNAEITDERDAWSSQDYQQNQNMPKSAY